MELLESYKVRLFSSELDAITAHTRTQARARAIAAYKDFLNLWTDADPDIPIYKEAKAKYAKLL